MTTVETTNTVADVYRRHISAGRARLVEMLGGIVEVSSVGSIVHDADGRDLLDCGGYGVFLLGHAHPVIVEAVQRQVATHALTTRLLLDGVLANAAQAVAEAAPEGLDRVYFATSGADAVEAALKLARMHGKRRLVSTIGGFHGKTFGALSVSGNSTLQAPFEPLLPDTVQVPFGDAAALRAELDRAPGGCCVIVEPIQAEGGVRIPPVGYLRAVADACEEFDALLVVDEIATGLGRIGRWWAVEQEEVIPDVLLTGKPLGGGIVPIGAVIASESAFAPLDRDPFIHSATFSGSPIATAAAAATIGVLQRDGVPELAAGLGQRLLAGLREALVAAVAAGIVREVRGAGLLIGIEFAQPADAGEFEIELVKRRVIPNHCMNQHAVVRLTPSAYFEESEESWLIDAVGEAADVLVANTGRARRSN